MDPPLVNIHRYYFECFSLTTGTTENSRRDPSRSIDFARRDSIIESATKEKGVRLNRSRREIKLRQRVNGREVEKKKEKRRGELRRRGVKWREGESFLRKFLLSKKILTRSMELKFSSFFLSF